MNKRHSAGFLELVEAARGQIEEVTTEEAMRRQAESGAVLIDVREDLEFARGACPGAVHVGKGVIERDIERLYPQKTTELILYCGGGYRSALAALSLAKMGYLSVRSMAGGFRRWCEEGRPIGGPEL